MATLYTVTGCWRCEQAKRILDEEAIFYIEVDLLKQPSKQYELKEVYHEVVTPVLYHEGKVWKLDDLLNRKKGIVIT